MTEERLKEINIIQNEINHLEIELGELNDLRCSKKQIRFVINGTDYENIFSKEGTKDIKSQLELLSNKALDNRISTIKSLLDELKKQFEEL